MGYEKVTEFREGHTSISLLMTICNMTPAIWALLDEAEFRIKLPSGENKTVIASHDDIENTILYVVDEGDFDVTVQGVYKAVGKLTFTSGLIGKTRDMIIFKIKDEFYTAMP